MARVGLSADTLGGVVGGRILDGVGVGLGVPCRVLLFLSFFFLLVLARRRGRESNEGSINWCSQVCAVVAASGFCCALAACFLEIYFVLFRF